jgi:hypothetical protein
VKAASKIFNQRKPINFQSDKGSEFVNRRFLKFLKNKGVHFFTTESDDVKNIAAIVKCFNRTLPEKMLCILPRRYGPDFNSWVSNVTRFKD